MNRNQKLGAAVGAIAITVALGATGCVSSTAKSNQNGLDAGQYDKADMTKAITIVMPDGFSNVAAKCVGHEGIYVIFHNDGSYGAVSTQPNDPNCATGVYVDPNVPDSH